MPRNPLHITTTVYDMRNTMSLQSVNISACVSLLSVPPARCVRLPVRVCRVCLAVCEGGVGGIEAKDRKRVRGRARERERERETEREGGEWRRRERGFGGSQTSETDP